MDRDKPHDHFAGCAWEVLLGTRRRARAHARIDLPSLEADFLAEPGPALPPWMGMLAQLAATHLVLGESETGYLTHDELRTAQLKLHAGLRLQSRGFARGQAAEKEPRLVDLLEPCLLILAEQVTEAVLRAGLPGVELERPEPGMWLARPGYRLYIVSTTQLAFREDTALIHLLCRGPWRQTALRYLLTHPDPEARGCGDRLSEEVEQMQSHRAQALMTDEERAESNRLYRASREALEERGRQTGRLEGRLEGKREDVLAIWRRRFGEPEAWMVERLQACMSLELLDSLLIEVAIGTCRSDVEAAVRALPDPAISH